MNLFLAADVGSTYTKLTAVDITGRKVIGQARAFTTIESNVMEGFQEALTEIRAQCGPLDFKRRAAASSAAGGLKMIAVGLVPDLTVQAARLAAANAGAKIMKTYAFELAQDEIDEIISLSPDMILLAGGFDGGNQSVILHNARRLRTSGLACALIVAGNKSARDELKKIMAGYPGQVIFGPNVMPEIKSLNIEPTQEAIRELFIRNIISAKGLDSLQAAMDSEIIPTPLAVLAAASLLSRGLKGQTGLGELMLFDVGGATTDVCSLSEGRPTRDNVFRRGLNLPYAHRTVEGDLGLRYSLPFLLEAVGPETAAGALNCPKEALMSWVAQCRLQPEILPRNEAVPRAVDNYLTGRAVALAAERHVGFVEEVFTALGRAWAQTGKDLSQAAYVIGTGGPIINAADPLMVLNEALWRPEDLGRLKPLRPKLLVDRNYILSAMGSVARFEAEAALSIMLDQFTD